LPGLDGLLLISVEAPLSHLLVVSACSANKNCSDLDKESLLTENDLDDPVRRAAAEMRLKKYSLPAAQMYIGLGHGFVCEAITALGKHGYLVSHFILSAGYGFLNENDVIVPYNVTFAKKPKRWIRERGQRLGLRDRLVAAAKEYDLAILILGREYLEAKRKNSRQPFILHFAKEQNMSDKIIIGTVLSDSETPTFETVRIKLKSGQDVKPGTLVKIPVTLDGSTVSLIGRVKSAYEHNPHESAEDINVRDTLKIEPNYPQEEDSTVIYRQVEAELIKVDNVPIVCWWT
jgi:hypothetical protein